MWVKRAALAARQPDIYNSAEALRCQSREVPTVRNFGYLSRAFCSCLQCFSTGVAAYSGLVLRLQPEDLRLRC